jgi:hypothetical protein
LSFVYFTGRRFWFTILCNGRYKLSVVLSFVYFTDRRFWFTILCNGRYKLSVIFRVFILQAGGFGLPFFVMGGIS